MIRVLGRMIAVAVILVAIPGDTQSLSIADAFETSQQRRNDLASSGVALEAAYVADVAGVLSGGLETGVTYLDNVDLTTDLDLDVLFGWSGTSIHTCVLGNNGGDPSAEFSGDAQGFTNIETDDTWKLYELWVQKEWDEGNLSVLFGLYDLNSEFDTRDGAGLFLNSSQGIGADYAQSGENGPSIFPSTSLALRLRRSSASGWYGQLAVFDGVPGDPDKPEGTRIILDGDDGLLIAAESGVQPSSGKLTKAAVGAWAYTTESADIRTGETSRVNRGIYALAESQFPGVLGSDRNLTLTGRVGVADGRVNQFAGFVGFGLILDRPWSGRGEDLLGLALSSAINGSRFNDTRQAAGMKTVVGETALEVTYRVQATSWLALQPNLQYIIHPGGVSGQDNVMAYVVRTELVF